jgi:hypothetical protein
MLSVREAGTAYLVQRNATGWTISGGRIPVEVRFCVAVQTGPGAHPASCTIGTGSLSMGVKRPGYGVEHPHHLRRGFMESRAIPLFPHCTFMGFSTMHFTYQYVRIYKVELFVNWKGH